MIEKRQDGSVGLNLSVAGLFILTVCEDLSVKSGCCLEPGICFAKEIEYHVRSITYHMMNNTLICF